MPGSLIAGVLGVQLLTSIPDAPIVYITAIVALPALVYRPLRPLSLLLLAGCWTLFQYDARLDDRLDPVLSNRVVTVVGVVSSLPSVRSDSVRFLFQPAPPHRDEGFPTTLLVAWYRDFPEISVGQQWQLQLKVKPPWGSVNFQGPDKERWLFATGIGGQGTVRSGRLLSPASGWRYAVNSWREQILQIISEQVTEIRQRGVIQALATADRSGISGADRALLTATGTAHLLAISGLHVGLAAAGGMWLGRSLILILPVSRMGGASLTLTVGGGLLGASVYAALAGFGVPTLRSVLMLFTALCAAVLSRSIHPARAWVMSLAIILTIDPFAPLGAGLWFSYLAVAALLWVFLPRTGTLSAFRTMLLAQAAVILVLTPISAAWFGIFSPSGFFANLLAIPWVSFLVVPPVLAGLGILPFSEHAAGILWSAAGFATSKLFLFLEAVSALQGRVLDMQPPTLAQTALAFTGAAICLLPRGLPVRWMGLFLLAPLFLPAERGSAQEVLAVEILDAGQGTAAVISSGAHSLLYDSGPGDGGERNLVASVLAPALARLGRTAPEQVVISHGDLDHAGGVQSLLDVYPDADFRANLRNNRLIPGRCITPLAWSWPGITIDTLHPSPWLPYLGNDSSCVLSIVSGVGGLLLSGDISEAIEKRLIRDGIGSHRLLLVPHHGSMTSSSPAFIERMNPEVAVVTASLGNRFGFPHPEVRERYEAAGARFWSTGDCGAIRVVLETDGTLRAASARRERMRIWRWPPAANCP